MIAEYAKRGAAITLAAAKLKVLDITLDVLERSPDTKAPGLRGMFVRGTIATARQTGRRIAVDLVYAMATLLADMAMWPHGYYVADRPDPEPTVML